jgi:hypothetical protein
MNNKSTKTVNNCGGIKTPAGNLLKQVKSASKQKPQSKPKK